MGVAQGQWLFQAKIKLYRVVFLGALQSFIFLRARVMVVGVEVDLGNAEVIGAKEREGCIDTLIDGRMDDMVLVLNVRSALSQKGK